jgi:hypothetical protein
VVQVSHIIAVFVKIVILIIVLVIALLGYVRHDATNVVQVSDIIAVLVEIVILIIVLVIVLVYNLCIYLGTSVKVVVMYYIWRV